MFGKIGKFLAKRALPVIIANLIWDVDTVHKSDGVYLKISIEAFGVTLLKDSLRVYKKPNGKKLELPDELENIDVRMPNSLEALKNSALDEINQKTSANFNSK